LNIYVGLIVSKQRLYRCQV